MFMKRCGKVVVLGALMLLLGGCFLQNHRVDYGEKQYASNVNIGISDDKDVFFF